MITIDNVCYSYKKQIMALKRISVDIPRGFTLLIGENGSGKTTLLKALSAILPVDGAIAVDGIDIANPQYKQLISYLPQEFSIYPKLKVYDILHFVASMKGIGRSDIKSEVNKAAEHVNITSYLSTRFDKCSVGTRRRVGIATTLLGSPEAIFLDEPTAGIDPKERISFYKSIKSIFKDKYVILSTHILDDIEILADYIVMISNGLVAYSGTYSDFLHSLDGKLYELQVPIGQKHEHIHSIVTCSENNGVLVYRYVVSQKQREVAGSMQVAPTSEDLWLYYQMRNDSYVE